MTIAKMLTGVLMTAAGRIISALGFSVVSYAGLDSMQSYFIREVSSALGSLPQDGLQILYIGGFGVVLNWIFGAFSFVVTLKSLKKLSTIIGQK